MAQPLVLSLASFLLSLITWVAYFARLPSGNIPARPVGSVLAQVASLAVALYAILLGPAPSAAVYGLGGLAVVSAGLFLWLLTQRKTPVGDIRVKVGDALLPFAVSTDGGATFRSEDLMGKRTLFKFFRGSW